MEVGRVIVAKWKPFFLGLEELHGLRVDSAAHLWLVHHLFLHLLNDDIINWSKDWNSHVMRLKEQRNSTPRDLFLLGLRRRQIDDAIGRQEEHIHDLREFGVDWDALRDEELVRQLQEQGENPFNNYAPDTLSDVPCEPPECPLTRDERNELDALLATEFNLDTYDMDVYKAVWIRALAWCNDMF